MKHFSLWHSNGSTLLGMNRDPFSHTFQFDNREREKLDGFANAISFLKNQILSKTFFFSNQSTLLSGAWTCFHRPFLTFYHTTLDKNKNDLVMLLGINFIYEQNEAIHYSNWVQWMTCVLPTFTDIPDIFRVLMLPWRIFQMFSRISIFYRRTSNIGTHQIVD